MQKVRVPINSFQYGEVSDSLIMRVDTPIYAQSAQHIENMIITAEGAAKKRFGLKHLYDYGLSSTGQAQSHLFRFIFDSNEEYIISIEEAKIRCFFLDPDDGSITLVDTLTQDVDGDPLPFDEDYIQQYTTAQYGDAMFICHPLFAPRTLIRTSLTTFELSTYSFDRRADNLITYQPYTAFQAQGVTLDPSATSGTGITLTTSVDYWTPEHVGSIVIYGDAEIEITGYTSPTVVTADVIDELKIRLTVTNPLRSTEKSQVVEVTQIQHGYEGGETIAIEGASSFGGIPTTDINTTHTVGNIIDENTYTITVATSASSISAEDGGGIVSVVTHAPTRDWAEQSWSAVRGYPAAVTFHENRLCFGGTLAEPDTIWMSKIGSFFNFDVGDAEDDDSINLIAATGDVNEIRYMISNRDLQIFTASSELYVPTYLNQAITPTNAQIRRQTPYGTSFVQPASIDGATIFVAINGRIVREYLYTDSEDAYTSNSISTLASHLIREPRCMAVAHSGFGLPDSYALLTLSDGTATVFSSNRAERRASWTRITTAGTFCSTVAIEDRLFVNVYDEGGNLHLCEFTGDVGLDFYKYTTLTNYEFTVATPFSAGDEVSIVGTDGTNNYYLGEHTADGAGLIDLTAYSSYGITHVWYGKEFTSKIITNPFDANVAAGPVTGEIRGVTNVVIDMKDSVSLTVNNRPVNHEGTFTGKKEVKILGYNRDPQITIEQNEPLSMQINGLVAELIV